MQHPAALLELQAADIEIMRAKKRLDELPEKKFILEVRAKQRDVSSMREKAGMLIRKLEGELKARQDEIATITEKIGHEQAKIMETADHRQVQALTREMDGLRRRVDKLEMESIAFLERLDKANVQVGTIDEALSGLAEKEKELIDRFRHVGGDLQSEISAQESKREKLAVQLPAEMLAAYEKERAAKGGIGVGELVEDGCTACRMSLPAERVRELTKGPDVGICPQCRRLIVVRRGEE